MQIKIPFTRYSLNFEKRGINMTDRKTGLPISFDTWLSKFNLGGKTPLLENIYDTIASEFSKIDLLLVQDTLDKDTSESKYEILREHDNFNVLALRPNVLQTKSELLYTIAYQLHKYRNALVRIVRRDTDRNIVDSLEPINCEDYLFGQGYELSDGRLILKLKEIKTNKIILLDYMDIIHVRLNPNDFFYGDKNEIINLNHFVKLFDENLNALFDELKNNGTVSGIVELGGVSAVGGFNAALKDNKNKEAKQKEIIDRIKSSKGGVLVLDSGEKWTSLTRPFKTMSAEEVNSLVKYLYNFKGINEAVINGTATPSEVSAQFGSGGTE